MFATDGGAFVAQNRGVERGSLFVALVCTTYSPLLGVSSRAKP
jgi:hypothetical protein